MDGRFGLPSCVDLVLLGWIVHRILRTHALVRLPLLSPVVALAVSAVYTVLYATVLVSWINRFAAGMIGAQVEQVNFLLSAANLLLWLAILCEILFILAGRRETRRTTGAWILALEPES